MPDTLPAGLSLTESHFTDSLTSASVYAHQCYGNNSMAQVCSTYVQKALPFTMTKNTECPFPGKEKICLHDHANIRLDTGFLDSHDHLGINTNSETRFAYRRVDECAPLITDQYTFINHSDLYSPNNISIEYMYGSRFDGNNLLDFATYRVPLYFVDSVPAVRDIDYQVRYQYAQNLQPLTNLF